MAFPELQAFSLSLHSGSSGITLSGDSWMSRLYPLDRPRPRAAGRNPTPAELSIIRPDIRSSIYPEERRRAVTERQGVVTFKGNPMTLIGPDVREGSTIGDFTLLAPDLTPVTRGDLRGKTVLFNVVASIDTGVCSAQTKRFNEELETLPKSVEVITVSADLPFAQSRFATVEKIRHRMLSDYRDFSFAQAFGIGIKELRLLARSIFVVGPDGKVVYRQIVPEVTHHPNYEAALDAAREG